MVKVLHDLWIMSDDGIVLYNRVYNPKVETQLFGALLSALNSFAEEITEGGLTNFQLSDKQFVITKRQELLFIANSSKKVKEKAIIGELENISDKFFAKYTDVFKEPDWKNEIGIFSDFQTEIEESFKDPVKKFWDGF